MFREREKWDSLTAYHSQIWTYWTIWAMCCWQSWWFSRSLGFFNFAKNWENYFCWFNILRSQEMLWLILPHWSLYRVSATWKEDYKNWALNGFSRREKHLISSSLFFTSIQLFFYLHSTGESYFFCRYFIFYSTAGELCCKMKTKPFTGLLSSQKLLQLQILE